MIVTLKGTRGGQVNGAPEQVDWPATYKNFDALCELVEEVSAGLRRAHPDTSNLTFYEYWCCTDEMLSFRYSVFVVLTSTPLGQRRLEHILLWGRVLVRTVHGNGVDRFDFRPREPRSRERRPGAD